MKKIYLSLMLLGAVTFTSCDMDKAPYGALDENTVITKMHDLTMFRNQLYGTLRSVTSGSWVYTTDIQLDHFIGLISNGNKLGMFSKGTILPSDGDIESFWAGSYSSIATCNSIIAKCDEFAAKPDLSANDKVLIERYKGEAKFTRAYMYLWLADHYCQSYTQVKGGPEAKATGLPIVTTFHPTSDVIKYPSRSTLKETFDFINKDLSEAYAALKAYEATGDKNKDVAALLKPCSEFLSSFAVEALQARVALLAGDWATAKAKAEDVIENGNYSLANVSNYKAMWDDEDSSEPIFRPYMASPSEIGGSTGGIFLSDDQLSADYIPTFGTMLDYVQSEKGSDVRFDAFFTTYDNLKIHGVGYEAYVFNKYPGNDQFKVGDTKNFVNLMKPFRLSEMYLISAEADARMGNNNPARLNEFCANRYSGYETQTYDNTQKLLDDILIERDKEFICEGMRWSDLRRLNVGFDRYKSNPAEDGYDIYKFVVKAADGLSYAAGDHRLTWPIPKGELDANPNLKGQQNPGYGD